MAFPNPASRTGYKLILPSGVENIQSYNDPIEVDATGNTSVLAVGMIVTYDHTRTTKVEAVNLNTTDYTVLGIITELYDANGQKVDYLAASTAGSVKIVKFALNSGLSLEVSEDGVGGVSALDSGYCDIIQAVSGYTGTVIKPEPVVSVKLDSSGVSASAGNLRWTFTLANSLSNLEASGQSGHCRKFIIKPVAAKIAA